MNIAIKNGPKILHTKDTLTYMCQTQLSLLSRLLTIMLTCEQAQKTQFTLWSTFTFSIFHIAQKAFEQLESCQNLNNILVLNPLSKGYKTAAISLNTLEKYELFVVDLNVSSLLHEVRGSKTYKMPKFCQKRLRMLQKLHVNTSNLKHQGQHVTKIILLFLI